MLQTLRGTIYMFHWLVVMPSTTARMSVRPKQLKWIKNCASRRQAVKFDCGFIAIATTKIDIGFANGNARLVTQLQKWQSKAGCSWS